MINENLRTAVSSKRTFVLRCFAVLTAIAIGIVLGSFKCGADTQSRASDASVLEPSNVILPSKEMPKIEGEFVVSEIEIGRYASISEEITPEERGLLALVIYHESRGEPYEGQLAVAECVFNRYLSRFDGKTSIQDIIYAKGQFSCAKALTTAAIHEPGCLATAFAVVDEVLQETSYQIEDTDYYFNTEKPNRSDYTKIGNHYFY